MPGTGRQNTRAGVVDVTDCIARNCAEQKNPHPLQNAAIQKYINTLAERLDSKASSASALWAE